MESNYQCKDCRYHLKSAWSCGCKLNYDGTHDCCCKARGARYGSRVICASWKEREYAFD